MIQGGEEYVYAAYGIVWSGIVGYTLSLFRRLKAAKREANWQEESV